MTDHTPGGWPPPNEVLQAAAREMAASPLPLWARGPFYQAHQTLRTEAVSAYVAALVEAARREERKACAATAEREMRELFGDADEYQQGWNAGLEAGAAAIRARGDAQNTPETEVGRP
jgi:hypothetical protein